MDPCNFEVRDLLTQPEIMAQAAEDCMRLGYSFMELRKILDDENPTKADYAHTVDNVCKALGILTVSLAQLGCIDNLSVMKHSHVEHARWIGRLIRKRREWDRENGLDEELEDELEDNDEREKYAVSDRSWNE